MKSKAHFSVWLSSLFYCVTTFAQINSIKKIPQEHRLTTVGTVVKNYSLGHGNFKVDITYLTHENKYKTSVSGNFLVGSKFLVEYDSLNPNISNVLITHPIFTNEESTKKVIGTLLGNNGFGFLFRKNSPFIRFVYPYTNFNEYAIRYTIQYTDTINIKNGNLYEVEYLKSEPYDISYPYRAIIHLDKPINTNKLKKTDAIIVGLDSVGKKGITWSSNGNYILPSWNLKFIANGISYTAPVAYSHFESVGERFNVLYDSTDPNMNYIQLYSPVFANEEKTATTTGKVTKVKNNKHIIVFHYKVGGKRFRKYQRLMYDFKDFDNIKRSTFEVEYEANNPNRAIIHFDKPI